MPATRSQSTASRADPLLTPSPPRAHDLPLHLNFSSSDKTQKKQRPLNPNPVIPEEIIEISDDDDDALPRLNSQASMIADFRRQINKLREESVKHRKDYERAVLERNNLRKENQQLQALRKPGTLVDVEHLADHLDCEICTSRMWAPYFLPCGHIFCQSCLQDWFSTTLAQFMTTHPLYNVNQAQQNIPHLPNLIQTLIQHPQAAIHPQIANIFADILPPNPQYTCPTCREPVLTRPTEAFKLKAIVRVISAAAGENSPKKPVAEIRKGKAAVVAPGPWDGFFPRKTA